MFLSKNLRSNKNCLQPTSKFLLPNSHISTLKAHSAKGITLVALVVTIIVLLILAGVTITSLLGNDGIISKAQTAAQLTKKSQVIEAVQLDILVAQLEGDITQEKLEEILSNYGEVQHDEDGNITGLKVDGLDDIIPIDELYSGNLSDEPAPDTTAPSANISLGGTSTTPGTAISATVTFVDIESGVDVANCKYIYNTSSGNLGTDNEAWNSASTFTSNPQTLTLTASTEGTYFLHVLTVDVAGNKGEQTSDPVTVEEEGLSAEDIASAIESNPSDYYGKTVSGYTCTNSSAVANWKIFYAGNDFSADNSYHVYLIADDYIPRANIPNSSAGHALNAGSSSYPRAAYFSNILNDYSGSASITDSNLKKLNNDYFTKNYTSSGNNMKSVAYMLDTNAWSVYKGEDADYAVGGPPIEMLMKSYSQAHNVDYKAQALNSTGYQISNNGGSSWQYYIANMLSDSLYVIASQSNASCYWVSSPSAGSTDSVMRVAYDGDVNYDNYNNGYLGFRPLVCLSSDVKFEQLDNGNFQIK